MKNLCPRLTAILLLTAGVSVSANNLPDIGISASSTISPRAEYELGKQIMNDVQRQLPLLQDLYVQDYIQSLGTRLSSHSVGSTQRFHFFVVNAHPINAFALPGGFIGLHTGLIETAQNESELVAVMAHEMAHVIQRHIARMLERRAQLTVPTIAAILTSIALATQNPSAGSGAVAATVAGAQQYAINFTRDNEEEADRVGIDLMHTAGFSPNGMPDFFYRMDQANRFNKTNYPEFLMTHPVNENRLADAKARADQLPAVKTPARTNTTFQLYQTRVAFLTSNQFKPNHSDNSQVSQYGKALSALKNGDLDSAEPLAKKLANTYPNQALFPTLLAEIYSKQNKHQAAIKLLAQQHQLYPGSAAIVAQYAQTLLQSNQSKKAIKVLQDYLKDTPPFANVYRLIAEAASASGNSPLAHEARADHLLTLGEYDNAIKQLELAVAAAAAKKDKFQRSALQAKLKEVEQKAGDVR